MTDAVIVDTAHGHSSRVLKAVSDIRKMSNYTQVIVGNVATAEAPNLSRRWWNATISTRPWSTT